MLRFQYAGRSHAGLVRGNNEDAGFAGPTLQLVADGVGGAAAGEVASATAAYVTSALALAAASRPGTDLVDLLRRAAVLSHEQLRAGTAADPACTGMGTTLTALLTDGSRVALCHVGDSRAYLFRGGRLTQLTRDHTLVQTFVDEGLISRDEARTHPRRNVVLRAVEAGYRPVADVTLVDVRVGDRLLVCSDGLSDLVDDDQIRVCLEDVDAEVAVQCLVDAALAGGGYDNVTCLVSDVLDGPRLVPDGMQLGAFRDPRLVVDPSAVHVH
jgi:serine/threonine protein phosphatase PrpC